MKLSVLKCITIVFTSPPIEAEKSAKDLKAELRRSSKATTEGESSSAKGWEATAIGFAL